MNGENRDERGGQENLWSRLRKLWYGEPATRDSLLATLRDARWDEVISADEVTMLTGVLKVSETQVRDVMIPRAHMVVIERAAPKEEVFRLIVKSGHSRFPVIGEDRDEVEGILLAKDVLSYFLSDSDQPFDLAPFLRPPTFIPESKRLNTLLKEFRVSRNHIAIVVDEYGGTAGLLTIEDVLEEIVGEIDDEHDVEIAGVKPQPNGSYIVDGSVTIRDVNREFEWDLPSENYSTVAGLLLHEVRRIPNPGQCFNFYGFRFDIIRRHRNQITLVRVTPPVELQRVPILEKRRDPEDRAA